MKSLDLPQISILVFFIGQIIFFYYLRQKAYQNVNTHLQKKDVEKSWKKIFLFFGLHLLLISYLSTTDFFGERTLPPRFPLILAPHFIIMFWMLSWKMKDKFSFLMSIPAALLVGVQFYRFLLEFVILALYQKKIVPLQITFEGRSFEWLVGLAALATAYLLHKKIKNSESIGIAFNILGLVSLVNIVFTAATSFPSSFQLYDTNYLPTYFPGVLIPGFVAPFAVYMHVFSLKQLFFLKRIQNKGVLING